MLTAPRTSLKFLVDPEGRKRIPRATGRCFVCLRQRHIIRNCRSSLRCAKCRGRHHDSICSSMNREPHSGTADGHPPQTNGSHQPPPSSSLCVNCHTAILLQTAMGQCLLCESYPYHGGEGHSRLGQPEIIREHPGQGAAQLEEGAIGVHDYQSIWLRRGRQKDLQCRWTKGDDQDW